MIETPGPDRRVDARVEPDAAQVGPQLVDRRVAAIGVLGEDIELALEGRDLGPELVVAVVEVGHEDGQVLRGQTGERRAARLGAQLDDDEQAEQERHRGDRELVPTATHRGEAVPARGARSGA